MPHWGVAAVGRLFFFALVALAPVVALFVRGRIEARRRAWGRERRLWFDYATLAARTAREMRGESL